MSGEEWSHRLANPELRCKNKCGFYGSHIYNGYCSKCFKEVMSSEDSRFSKPAEIDEDEGGSNAGLVFSKFAMKKSIFSTAKGHHKLFKAPIKRSPGPGATWTSKNESESVHSQPPPQSGPFTPEQKKKFRASRSSDPFNEFMKTLRKPAAQDIVQHLKSIKKQIVERSTATVATQSDMIQGFYQSISERLKSHPLFEQMGEDEQEEMMDGIEKHLMTSIYNKVFSPASCDDEIKDILLVRRFNRLHWLEASHLDVTLDMDRLEVQNVFEQAREELWNMESKKAPQDKLSCIARSCKKLFEALQVSQGGPASADEFLPALIFLIIHTSCQHLFSNLNYIERFSQPGRLQSGEMGYYFTNLYGAVTFIENISAENLKLSKEEFNSKMGYVDGKTDATLLIEEDDIEQDYEYLVVLQSCTAAMRELTDHMNQMSDELDILKEQMKEFQIGVKQRVESILRCPPPKSLYSRNNPTPTESGDHSPKPPVHYVPLVSPHKTVAPQTPPPHRLTSVTEKESPPPLITFD